MILPAHGQQGYPPIGLLIYQKEKTHFHRKADQILDQSSQKNGRGRLVIVKYQPQGIKPQVDQDHNDKERNTHIGKGDFLSVEQKELLKEFFNSSFRFDSSSEIKERFINVWNCLFEICRLFPNC